MEELASSLLRNRSKDLQLALWLTEAGMKRHGFPGLRDGLRLTHQLLIRYWDKGLYPAMEDGPEDRVGPFEWLNNKLVDSIAAIPITARDDGGQDYSMTDLKDARWVGYETSCKDPYGEIDSTRKKAFDAKLAQGHISLDMFDKAVAASRRVPYEELSADFLQTHEEFKALVKVVDDKFGDVMPDLSSCRTALKEIDLEISNILEKKRVEEPEATADSGGTDEAGNPVTARFPLSLPDMSARESMGGSWNEAEVLDPFRADRQGFDTDDSTVRTGDVRAESLPA